MKKILFLAAVTAIALTACTKTETTAVSEGNVIRFDNAFVGNPTKAGLAEVNTTNLSTFYVQGTKDNGTSDLFAEGFETVRKTTTGEWVYDNLQPWASGATWYFVAYSDGGFPTTADFELVSGTTPTLTINNYEVDETTPKDLIVAVASPQSLTSSNSPVEFTFSHALSQIKFTLTNGVSGKEIKISEFKVVGVKSDAPVTVNSTITWGTAANTVVLNNSLAEITATADAPAVTDNFAVIPIDYDADDEITVTFTATIDNGENDIIKDVTAKIKPGTTWDPGYRYNYTAEINGKLMDLIEFELDEVTKWYDNDPATTPIDDNTSSVDHQ